MFGFGGALQFSQCDKMSKKFEKCSSQFLRAKWTSSNHFFFSCQTNNQRHRINYHIITVHKNQGNTNGYQIRLGSLDQLLFYLNNFFFLSMIKWTDKTQKHAGAPPHTAVRSVRSGLEG